jgi:hypothetical protein
VKERWWASSSASELGGVFNSSPLWAGTLIGREGVAGEAGGETRSLEYVSEDFSPVLRIFTYAGGATPPRELLLNELYGLLARDDRVERRGEYASHSPFSAPCVGEPGVRTRPPVRRGGVAGASMFQY